MTQTAFHDAFTKAGLSPAVAALRVALAAFINAGGTTAQVRAELDAIDRNMSAAGQIVGADHELTAGDGLTRAETKVPASPITGMSPSGPTPSRGGDHTRAASQNEPVPAREARGGDLKSYGAHQAAVPVREPTARQRQITTEVRTLTVLDTFKIRDGRAIGEVRYGEIGRLHAVNAMEAAIFKQIKLYCSAPHDIKIRRLLTPEAFQRIQQRAAEIVDAA